MRRIDEPLERRVDADGLLAFVQKEFVDSQNRLGFRGHARASWKLEPTLTRYFNKLKQSGQLTAETSYKQIEHEIYNSFQSNVRVNNDLSRSEIDKIDLWQFGRHYGLPTPMLDWTYSPFIALFFALIEESSEGSQESLCLFVLDIDLLQIINEMVRREMRPVYAERIQPESALDEQFPEMELVDGIDAYSRRLAFQQGFFTKHIFYESFEVWTKRIAHEMAQEMSGTPLLTRVVCDVSEEQRSHLLRVLDKMNIHSRSLFPDIEGSVRYACEAVEHRRRLPFRSFDFSRSPDRDE